MKQKYKRFLIKQQRGGSEMKLNIWQKGLLIVLVIGVALMFGGTAREAQAKDHGKDKNQCQGQDQDKDHGKDKSKSSIPNNHPFKNPEGAVATFSTQGFVDLTSQYFVPQGTNGRS